MKIKSIIVSIIFSVICLGNAFADNLADEILAAVKKSDPQGKFQGITYRLTYNNSINFLGNAPESDLLFTPLTFGQYNFPAYDFGADDFCKKKICGAYNLHGANNSNHLYVYDLDFHLPYCHSSADCKIGSICSHLNIFENGVSGKNKKMCLSHSDAYLGHYYDVISSAKNEVDITAFYPFPNGRYLATLRNAITRLSYTGENITVHILVGLQNMPKPDDIHKNIDFKLKLYKFLQQISRDIPLDSQITINAATSITCGFFNPKCTNRQIMNDITFSHAKIVAADGKAVITGGHNLWDASYLGSDPISDVDVEIHGSAAQDAQNFAHFLWNKTCHIARNTYHSGNYGYSFSKGKIKEACKPIKIVHLSDELSSDGNQPILSVARMGAYWYHEPRSFANQSEIARIAAFKHAQKTIRISQQDIAGKFMFSMWPNTKYNDTMGTLAKFLTKNGQIYIIISDAGAQGEDGISYSYNVPLRAIAKRFFKKTVHEYRKEKRKKTKQDIADQLCRNLHIAHIVTVPVVPVIGTETRWGDNSPFGNHAKVWIIDDKAFYVGSHNMYPANLQEFGYIIFGENITNDFINQYWNKIWALSKSTDLATKYKGNQCIFQTFVKNDS